MRPVATFANMRFLPLTVLLALAAHPAAARPWSDEVVYFVMTDRFLDGDPENNRPAGSDPKLFDPSQNDINLYHGGDLRGLEKAIASGYFNDLGVTALWLTPVVRNVWRSGYDLGGWKSGYHGYWTQDWLDIDPHLTSKTSLSGQPYSDDAEGRMRHYRDFVRLARSRGIRVIQDAVLNHAGPVFFYDADKDGSFDLEQKDEWLQPFRPSGFHENAVWADVPQWNARRTRPDGPRELLGIKVPSNGILSRLDTYGRKGFSPDSLGKSDGEEVTCDFFSLRDLWTEPGSGHFDQLVDEFVTIYLFYLRVVGVDGLRIDTVKHVHHGFWDAFTERLRKKLGPHAADKILFGEIYDHRPEQLARYTWREDWPREQKPCLDSVLDFHFCFSAREFLRHPEDAHGSPAALEKALVTRTAKDPHRDRPLFNPNPGPDGLDSRDKMITFLENHDGLNRFRVDGISEERNRVAQGLVMTAPGIPCLTYGTEFALQDTKGKVGQDSETGRMTFLRTDGSVKMEEVRKSVPFREIKALAALRARLPVLRTGGFLPLWVDSGYGPEDDGILVFARASEDGEKFAVVAINASRETRMTGAGEMSMRLPDALNTAGKVLNPVLTVGAGPHPSIGGYEADQPLTLRIPPNSLVVFEAVGTAVSKE